MNKILVVVDMQNDFIDGALGTSEAQAIVQRVIQKIKDNEESFIIVTQDTHFDDYFDTQEGKKLPIKHCIYESEGWKIQQDIVDELSNSNIYDVEYLCKSIFGSFDLIDLIEDYGTNNKIEEIEFVGLCTDICVVSNSLIVKNAFSEIPITVDASCCAGVTPEKHAAALETMKSCQINVIGE